jgi:16S rRNA (guanine527-N7)-methyltransferase
MRGEDLLDSAPEDIFEAGLVHMGIEPDSALIDGCMIHLHEVMRWNPRVRLVSEADPRLIVVRHLLDSLSMHSVLEGLLREGRTGRPGRPSNPVGRGKPAGHAGRVSPAAGPSGGPGPFRIADAGSGGGFPGIPLALMYSRVTAVLIERKTKKAAFLRSVAGMLGLRERVTVFEGDVREARGPFPVVICRAFRPISEAYHQLCGLLPAEGGSLLFYAGTREKIDEELEKLTAGSGGDAASGGSATAGGGTEGTGGPATTGGGTEAPGGRTAATPEGVPEPRVIPLDVPFLEEQRHAVLFRFEGTI